MSPTAKKDQSTFILDINSDGKDEMVKLIVKIFMAKLSVGSPDTTKILLINTENTSNDMAAQFGGYEHIHEGDEIFYDPALFLSHIESAEPAEGNWLEGLKVAVEDMKNRMLSNVVCSQIVLLSDFKTMPKTIDDNLLEEIIADLNEYQELYLYIVGPEINPTSLIKSSEDVRNWMKNIDLTTYPNAIERIVKRTPNTVICSVPILFHLFYSFKKRIEKKPWNYPISLRDKVKFPVDSVRMLENKSEFKFIKPNAYPMKNFKVDNDGNLGEEIDINDIMNGVERHGKFVPIIDTRMFKINSSRCFDIIGFTHRDSISEYLMGGDGTYHVLPSSHDKTDVLLTFIERLYAKDMCMVVKKVFYAGNKPTYHVLLPKMDLKPIQLFLVELPYSNDLCCEFEELSTDETPKLEKNPSIYEFLNDCHLDNEKLILPLSPLMMFDLSKEKIINRAVEKYLEQRISVNDINIEFGTKLETLPEKLLEMFPERDEELNEDSQSSDDDYS